MNLITVSAGVCRRQKETPLSWFYKIRASEEWKEKLSIMKNKLRVDNGGLWRVGTHMTHKCWMLNSLSYRNRPKARTSRTKPWSPSRELGAQTAGCGSPRIMHVVGQDIELLGAGMVWCCPGGRRRRGPILTMYSFHILIMIK